MNLSEMIREQAECISRQAGAIANGTCSASSLSAARLLLRNAETLVAWLVREEEGLGL